MGALRLLLIILVFGAAGAHLLVYFIQEKLIFIPEKLSADFPFKFSRAFEEIFVPREGVVLNALRFRVNDPKGIILYFHGNAGCLRDWGETGAELSRFGYDVVIYDYRGYGKSTGRIQSEAELLADARAFYEIARKDFSEEKIVLFGRSLGSGIAVQLAAEKNPKLLVLESPFRSLKGMAAKRFPYIAPFVLRYTFRSDLFAPSVRVPVVLFHGDQDEVIPVEFAESLIADFEVPVAYHRVSGGHHNDLTTFPQYRSALEKTLKIP